MTATIDLPGVEGRLGRELVIAIQLARRAGDVVMAVRGGGDLSVEMKPGDEPVTIADRRASELIVAGLNAAFPDDVVISEENADDLRRLGAPRVWYIDPIDGTRDYISGRDGFSVMIGLCEADRPVLGVVFQPSQGNLFWSTPDGGAHATRGDEPARALRVSEVRDVAAIRLVSSASHRTPTIDEVKNALGIADEINIGSVGLKLALIALGERDLYVNPSSKCKSWDVCAPEAILRGAGGELTDTHGDPMRYDVEDLACRNGLVASNGHVHGAVIARLGTIFPRGGRPGRTPE